MKFVETIQIPAPADVVWPFVNDPVRIAEWNSKLLSIDRQRSGPVSAGEEFSILFGMGSGKQTLCRTVVTDLAFPERVTYDYRSMWKRFEQHTSETFQIEPTSAGVKVIHTVRFIRTGIPWYWQVVIWLIKTLGKPTGEPFLQPLFSAVVRQPRLCPQCGYDLRATPDQCPECGTKVG